MPNAKKRQRVKIRKNSLTDGLYIDRKGRWVPWKDATWFRSQEAAERFAQNHGVEVFGIFPCKCCIDP